MSALPNPITAALAPVQAAAGNMRRLSVIATDTLRHILEDPKTPSSVRLRACLAVLGNPMFTPPAKPLDPPQPLPTAAPLAALPAAGSPAPTPAKPVVTRVPSVAPPPDTPRNAPCPCGSGNKYKRCCGAGAPAVLYAGPLARRGSPG